jgi:hypothetical protein
MNLVSIQLYDNYGGCCVTFELLECGGVVFVLVGVPFQGSFAIGFLNLILGCG